jgi:hypothetical protein
MNTNFILIVLIIFLGLPVINYNFKILFIIILAYLLFYPEHRKLLYDNIGIDKMMKKNDIPDPNQKINKLNELLLEGKNIIKELRQYKKDNLGVYTSIKLAWKKIEKIAHTIIENPLITYPHHLYSILKDKRQFILDQMSGLIVSIKPYNLKELSSRYERTLPLDVHIRSHIRKITIVMDYILEIIQNNINEKWNLYPSTEISPVDIDFKSPEPYNNKDIFQI